MLAYSSISHAGFMLIAIAANNALGGRALLYYLIPYCAMSVGSFAVVAARERELNRPVTIENLAGFGWERPLLGGGMTVFMLGFAGFPLTGGFVGKFYVFSAAYDRGWTWLVIVGVAATAVSLYYYLGVIRAMYFRPPEELQLAPAAGGSPPRELLLQSAVGARDRGDGRLLLRRRAADRPRRTRPSSCRLGGLQAARGGQLSGTRDGQTAFAGPSRATARAWTKSETSARQASRATQPPGAAPAPDGGHRAVRTAAAPTSSTGRPRRGRARSVQGTGAGARRRGVEQRPNSLESRDRRRRHGEQEQVEREPVKPERVRRCRCDHERDRTRGDPRRACSQVRRTRRSEGRLVPLAEPSSREER